MMTPALALVPVLLAFLAVPPASASAPASARARNAEAAGLRGGGVARPAYPEACIMKLAAGKLRLELREDVPVPPVRYGSETPLSEFQDAIEPQWGQRPDFVLNSYVFALNRIYILDEKDYYDKMGRFVDDSIFHEFIHYFQVKYRGDTFEGYNGEYLESEAIDYQTWFRDTYMIPGVPASEACGR
ncbi:MAG: hypothetical protein ACYC2I_02590 [Elusimicrobiales bacterium]